MVVLQFFSTMKTIGCNLDVDNYNDIQCSFKHPITNDDVYFIPAACHMLKLCPEFKYILSYKFSQDHLEIFFARIIQSNGSNNNPILQQFKTAMKQILMKNAIKCQTNGNCNTFDDDPFGSILDFKWKRKLTLIDDGDENGNDTIMIDDATSNWLKLSNCRNSHMKDAKNNVLFYVSRFIVKKIVQKIECKSCITALLRKSIDHDYCSSDIHLRFVNFKNRGGLILPSDSVFKVIVEAEKMLLFCTENLKDLNISKYLSWKEK